MLSDDARTTIDALSNEELREEINKGIRSRFQGDKLAYLKTRYASIKEDEQKKIRQEDIVHKTKELDLAQEANILSRKANKLSKFAIAISVLAAIVSIGALIIDILSGIKTSVP